MRKINYLCWGILLFALVLSGCGKLERDGPKPANMPPEVFFSNIPEEGIKLSVNPRVYWYGTDKDGYITAYQYAVITDSVIEIWGGLESAKDSLRGIEDDSASWINKTAGMGVLAAHITAEMGHQEDIRLYADLVDSIFVAQHIFLRARDNMGDLSEIKTRMFKRNDHAPEIFIAVDSSFVEQSFYCLSEPTQTWRGIDISWYGLDILDYPDERNQPDFYYKWELWGPYADTLNLPTLNAPVDSSLDSILIEGGWIYDRWIMDNFKTFVNLENYPDSGYGWYQLKVWSRDDAFVSSKDSTTTFFRILKPLFRYEEPPQKTVLVLDATVYKQAHVGIPSNHSMVRSFYETALSELCEVHTCDNFNIDSLGDELLPTEDSLSRYDLVILLHLGKETGMSEDSYCKYTKYLEVGGRLWIIGMNNYGLTSSGRNYLAISIPPNKPCTRKISEYLGVDGVFIPGYSAVEKFIKTLDFIAAAPFGSWNLPLLEPDSAKAAQLQGYDPSKGVKNFPVNGIPYVTYEILSSYSDFAGRPPLGRRLYSFISRYGVNSDMHQMPCATTWIGPTYRIAEFTFPLNMMKDGDEDNPGAYEVFRRMVEWFMEDLPQEQ